MRASLSIRISAARAATFVAGAAMAAGPARPPSPAAPAASAPADAVPTVSLVGDPAPVPAAASKPGAAGAPAAAPATRPAATPSRAPGRATGPSSSTPALRAGPLGEAAPRPTADVRVQSRFAVKAKNTLLYGAAEYLSRGDFYNSPGARVGATFYPVEALGVELQVSHYWSSLNAEAERVKSTLGALPDSHAPTWLLLAGGRYSIGYGKILVGGLGGAIHFEPQAFVHAGMHIHHDDIGPSGDAGLGFLVFLTPKLFVRIDAAIVYEREDRSGQSVAVWGTLPSIAVGGAL
jgi:hypothetical protein